MKTQLRVREANSSDRDFVIRLMEQTLPPFYDGDHRAHAERLLATHLSGGEDKAGHFSFEQRMFVALTEDGTRIGFVNLVGKKQGNYKISPLILDPEFRGVAGYGTQLLEFTEQYVQSQSCRQLYCTVAGNNESALTFFLRHGFTLAGKSKSHYKLGVEEHMLYKRFISTGELITMDSEHISVRPFDYAHREQFESLVYQQVAPFFKGVDDAWIQATFDGYERRKSGDINSKYKLMFEAVNHLGEFRGAVALTPKKGQPIKVMPLVTVSPQAFLALLEELPKLAYGLGHKLYIHLVPSVEQTAILQKLGWQIEAVMPGAYSDQIITQQWGFHIGDNMKRTLRLKNTYLKLIKSGQKTVEVRVGFDSIKRIQAGDILTFITYGDTVSRRVQEVKKFENFEKLLEVIESGKIVPGKNKQDTLRLLREIYGPDKEALGVYAFILG